MIVLTDAKLRSENQAEWTLRRDAAGFKMVYDIGFYDEFQGTAEVGSAWLRYDGQISFTLLPEHCGKGYALAAIEQLLRLHPELGA